MQTLVALTETVTMAARRGVNAYGLVHELDQHHVCVLDLSKAKHTASGRGADLE
jgi:hypothetical protein